MVGVIALLKAVLSPRYPLLSGIIGGLLSVAPAVYLIEPALDAIGSRDVHGGPYPRRVIGSLLLALSLVVALMVMAPLTDWLAELIAAAASNS
jgi:hypothetical protein